MRFLAQGRSSSWSRMRRAAVVGEGASPVHSAYGVSGDGVSSTRAFGGSAFEPGARRPTWRQHLLRVESDLAPRVARLAAIATPCVPPQVT
jgi:hypothetical protein